MSTPRLVLTPGEPAGIGIDLAIQLAQAPRQSELVCLADPKILQQRAAQLGLPLTLRRYDPAAGPTVQVGELVCCDDYTVSAPVQAGCIDPANADYVLQTLQRAADGCLDGEFAALVTGPVQKSALNDAGIAFTGHTEFFCERSGVPRVVMMLVAEPLRVALVTTHVPLQQVAGLIRRDVVADTVRKVDLALRGDWGVAAPRILVAGLNPHAGEGGHLGREEIEEIGPALDLLRGEGLQVNGPLPADTLFTPRMLRDADAVVAMYHDQGLPVLKHAGFGRAVNVTLGLPFIRTSVDHGTALDLAGRGRADAGSLLAAVTLAETMVANRQKRAAAASE